MLITNEMDYRQHLERKQAIQEHLQALRKEKTKIDAAIFEYLGSNQWLTDRCLQQDDNDLITTCQNLELTKCLSTGTGTGTAAPILSSEDIPERGFQKIMPSDDNTYSSSFGKLRSFITELSDDGVVLYGAGGEVIDREEEELFTTDGIEDTEVKNG